MSTVAGMNVGAMIAYTLGLSYEASERLIFTVGGAFGWTAGGLCTRMAYVHGKNAVKLAKKPRKSCIAKESQ